MKKYFQFFVLTVLAVFVFGVGNNVRAQGEVVRVLYQKMGDNQKSLKSLKSKVRMKKYNAQLRDDETEQEGIVMYIPAKGRNANVRIDWTYPQQETLSSVNGKYLLYRPRLEQVIEGKTKDVQKKDASGGLQFINMSAQELKQNFDAKYLGAELIANNSVSAYKLKLTPKKAMQYDYAEVWVTEDGMPVQAKIYEKNGDWTNVLLFNVEKNTRISAKDLVPNIPKSVKRIKG